MDLQCSHTLLEVMFCRLDEASIQATAIEHKELARISFGHAKKINTHKKGVDTAAYHAFHQAAYNCLSAVLMRTQKQVKPFGVLCFSENAKLGELLWEHIVDRGSSPRLRIATDFEEVGPALEPLPDYAVGVRGGGKRAVTLRTKGSPAYLSSQYLANSSVGQDVLEGSSFFARIDAFEDDRMSADPSAMSSAPVVGGRSSYAYASSVATSDLGQMDVDLESDMKEPVSVSPAPAPAPGARGESAQAAVDRSTPDAVLAYYSELKSELQRQAIADGDIFEMDSFNCNPCMKRILHLIDHCHFMFGKEEAMPQWMANLCRKLSYDGTEFAKLMPEDGKPDETELCIKWFIAKIVINRWRVFGPFAHHFFEPLVNLCISAKNEETGVAVGFHYMLRDVCYTIIKWIQLFGFSVESDPIDRDSASRLVDKLVKESGDVGEEEDALVESKSARLKSNLALVKAFVEEWREVVTIDKSIILDMIRIDIPKTRTFHSGRYRVLVGLQLLGITLVNGYPVYDPHHDRRFTEEALMEAVMAPITATVRRKDLYCAACEILGMILDQFDPDPDANETTLDGAGEADAKEKKDSNKRPKAGQTSSKNSVSWEERIRSVLKSLFQKSEFDVYVNCLVKIGARHPKFIDRSIMGSFFPILPNLHGVFLPKGLQLAYWYARHEPTVIHDLLPTFTRLSRERECSIDAHRMLLLILERVFQTAPNPIVVEWTPKLKEMFSSHPDTRCRELFYRLLMWLWDNFEKGNAEFAKFRRDQLEVGLLGGFSDPSAEIRKAVYNFWDNPNRISPDPTHRLLECFRSLYHPSTEGTWLQCSTYLLLNPMRRSADFARPLSDKPLEDCKFVEVAVDSSWHSRSLMAPLFAAGIVSSQGEDFSTFSQDADRTAALRGGEHETKSVIGKRSRELDTQAFAPAAQVIATQAPRFEPSVGGTFSLYGAVSPSISLLSLDSDNLFKLNLTQAASSSNSLVSFGPSRSRTSLEEQRKARRKARSHAQQQGSTVALGSLAEFDEIYSSRRRFGRAADEHSKSTAIRVRDERKRFKEVWAARQREAREHKVAMFRSYRGGELPDIQIPYKDVLLPLQALHMDPEFAKILFPSLFKSIYESIEQTFQADRVQAAEMLIGIHLSLNSLLQQLPRNPSVIFCVHLALRDVHEVAVKSGVQVDSDHELARSGVDWAALSVLIGTSSLRSNNFHSGLLALEQLFEGRDKFSAKMDLPLLDVAQAPKRRKNVLEKKEVNDALLTQEIGVQLAALYSALGEDDVVKVVHQTFSKSPLTKAALDAAMLGDHLQAQAHFAEGLRCLRGDDDAPPAGFPDGEEPTDHEVRLWEAEFMAAFEQLGRWDDQFRHIELAVAPMGVVQHHLLFPDAGSGGVNADVTRRQFLRSGLKLPAKWPLVKEVVESNLLLDRPRAILEAESSPELALLFSVVGDSAKARIYVQKSLDTFLSTWANLPVLSKQPRALLLQNLQSIVEIDEYLSVDEGYGVLDSQKASVSTLSGAVARERVVAVERVVSQWLSRFPADADPLGVWDSVVTNRNFFLHNLKAALSSLR